MWRAQAITPQGSLVDDFAFAETPRIVHVINAPSPAATAALSIGRFIAEKVAEREQGRGRKVAVEISQGD